jgi:hypothetical protein
MIQESVLHSIDDIWSLKRALFPSLPFEAARFRIHTQSVEDDLQLGFPGHNFANIHLIEMRRLCAQ